MKKIIYSILLLLFFSCNSFLDQVPTSQLTYENAYKTEKDIESLCNGLHSCLRETFGNVNARLYRERAFTFDWVSDIWAHTVTNELNEEFTPADQTLSWYYEYKVIAQANLLMELVDKSDLPQDRKNHYMGQACFARGFTTFYIAQMWGNAPYPKGTEDIQGHPLIPGQELVGYAIDDFKQAAALLPVASDLTDSKGNAITTKQYASKGSAWAMLARACAWMAGVYKQTELLTAGIAAADSVINSPDYGLEATIKDVSESGLHRNSRESIFEIAFTDLPNQINNKGSDIAWCAQKYPIEPKTTTRTKRTLLRLSNTKAFELYPAPDDRREEWFEDIENLALLAPTINQNSAYIKKFRHPLTIESGSQIGKIRAYDNNFVIIRLADIYLLRAEMKAKINDRAGAIADLNVIRGRANATLYSAGEDLTKAIALEREKELFMEGLSTLYLDKMRNGTTNELPGNFAKLTPEDIADGALYLPINTEYLKDNTVGRQNTYWARHGF